MPRALAAAALAAALLGLAGPAQAGDVAGAPLPKGARAVPAEDGLYLSPLGFRATVDWYRHELDRRGVVADFLPVEKVRSVAFVRILARDPAVSWSAVHIVLAEGETTIYIVAPKSGRGSSNGRTTDSGSVYLGSNPSPRTTQGVSAP